MNGSGVRFARASRAPHGLRKERAMTRRAKCGAMSFFVGVAISGLCAAADGLEGAALLDLPGGPVQARTVDLDPRLLGDVVFAWDGSLEQAVGWQNNVDVGEYVQAYDLDGTLVSVFVCGLGSGPSVTARVSAVVYDDDGPDGTPGTLLAMSEASAIPGAFNDSDCIELTVPATVRSGRTFIGALWMPSQDPASSSPPTTRMRRRSRTCTAVAGPAAPPARGSRCAT